MRRVTIQLLRRPIGISTTTRPVTVQVAQQRLVALAIGALPAARVIMRTIRRPVTVSATHPRVVQVGVASRRGAQGEQGPPGPPGTGGPGTGYFPGGWV